MGEFCLVRYDNRCIVEIIIRFFDTFEVLIYEFLGMLFVNLKEEILNFFKIICMLMFFILKVGLYCDNMNIVLVGLLFFYIYFK